MMVENLLGCLVHLGGFADVERDRFGLAAGFDYPGYDGIQRILPPPRDHHCPAIRRQRLGAGLADATAAAGHPGYAFPII